MKGKVAMRPPRAPSTPKYSDKQAGAQANKPRRSALPEKQTSGSRPGLEITRPLTARDPGSTSRPYSQSRPLICIEGIGAPSDHRPRSREAIHSLSPARHDLVTPSRPMTRGLGDKMKGRLENYAIGKQLGQGAYAVVRLGTHKLTKEKVAIKSYEKGKLLDPHRKLSVKREISILEKLNHTNAIKLIETIESPKHLNLVMEYVGGCSLHGYIKQRANRRIDPGEARRLFRQVLAAIQYCHSVNVTHRDIKLENILLDDNNNVKLIDFGFSTCMPLDKRTSTFCGTPSYMAPEIVSRREYAGPPADIWALGVLLYAMLCGCFPFKGSNDAELYRKIQKGVFSVPEHVEEGPKRVIRKMMQVDPSKRPTAGGLMSEEWVETGVSEAPQPEPPKAGLATDSSSHEADLLESLGRLGYSGSAAALMIKPMTATRDSDKRLGRKTTMANVKVDIVPRRNTSQPR